MSNDAQLQKNTTKAVTVSEAPLSTTTVQQQRQQEHPQPPTQPIPGSVPPADDSRSRHVNANASPQPSQPQTQTQTQQHVIYAPTPHPPRRSSHHEPRRRPKPADDHPSLALAATDHEHLGRIPSNTQSLPQPRSRSREPPHVHHDQRLQRPHSLDDERHSILVPDTTSWIVPAEKRQVRINNLFFHLPPFADISSAYMHCVPILGCMLAAP
ncbi:hypothetical protein BGW80DRAFT_123235 [Lactifluus volemus]|nr:hypothetical protein BGW80DRAFT_123235 [Lactifluus volemus]